MEKGVLLSKTIRNVKYVMIMQGVITLITTVLNILLARFVRKGTYGFVSINASLVVMLTNNLLKGGFRMALQKSEFSQKKAVELEDTKNFHKSVMNSVKAFFFEGGRTIAKKN